MTNNYEVPKCILKFIQDSISKIPVIVIGSGASAAYGIAGMGQLANYLKKEIIPTENERELWEEFKQLLNNDVDLESALHKVDISERLEKEVVLKTKELILPKDIEIREKLVLGEVDMPLSLLISHLNETANPQIKVVTTNYDRIVEYAVDYAGIDYYSGFLGKYIQKFDGRFNREKVLNKIEILKVHGSLDWYTNSVNEVLALPDSFQNAENLFPTMVTPGKNKYQLTHDDPFRTLITRVDSVFLEAKSLLIIGFGFNDDHIQPKLMQKMRSSQTPIIIISKELTLKTREFIKTNEDSKILGIEEYGDGSNCIWQVKNV
ncbi:SIR2 family protein [Oceanobacillus kapialis]|uniref:SIR2 family protein n=1 Tax=Oceanobacillus kapialis TaxID=481353 RepID=A0ABW5PXF7_9BACI